MVGRSENIARNTVNSMAGSVIRGKKKITQNDLRRLMTEQKRKVSEAVKKIDSPLAKYPFFHHNFRLCFALCIVCDIGRFVYVFVNIVFFSRITGLLNIPSLSFRP
jgi:hypothetical protein